MARDRRNYKQFCGLARALDVVGERWTLLVLRNLLLGPKRYSDLLDELPGITTNLLALRLREMEQLGLVVKRAAPPPVRATVYELGPNGRALEPALMELARWGSRFMDAPHEGDTINVGWALLSLKRRYGGGLDLVAEVVVDQQPYELACESHYLRVTQGTATRPDVVVRSTRDAFRAWLFGGGDPVLLRTQGKLHVEGSESAWNALRAAFNARETSAEELAACGVNYTQARSGVSMQENHRQTDLAKTQ